MQILYIYKKKTLKIVYILPPPRLSTYNSAKYVSQSYFFLFVCRNLQCVKKKNTARRKAIHIRIRRMLLG